MKLGVHTLIINKLNLKKPTLRCSLYGYSVEYILVKGNITGNNTAAIGAAANILIKK